MNRSIWRSAAAGLVVVLVVGCNDPNWGMGGRGLIVEDEGEAGRAAEEDQQWPEDADRRRDDGGRDSGSSLWGQSSRSDRTDPMPSRSERWGSERRTPSESMPSRTESWGSDRPMPSDSMPSRRERWGSDRPMPSESMPSRSESWGSERHMPSDSMPSRSFPRRSDHE